MKLKDTFVTYASGDEHIMVATEGFLGMVRSNKTAAFIIEALKEPTTPEKIVESMSEKYDAHREVIERDVERVLERLRAIGAIEE